MTGWLTAALMLTGSTFMLIAAIGVWRFPDVFTRMQAAAKAGTLGVGCLMAAVAVRFGELTVTAHVVVIVLFLLLTSPVAAHRIARSAHRIGSPLWEGTHRDELRDYPGGEVNAPPSEDAGGRPTGAPPRGGTST